MPVFFTRKPAPVLVPRAQDGIYLLLVVSCVFILKRVFKIY